METDEDPVVTFFRRLFIHLANEHLPILAINEEILIGIELCLEMTSDDNVDNSTDEAKRGKVFHPKPSMNSYPLWHPIVTWKTFDVNNLVVMAEKITQSNRSFDVTKPFHLYCTLLDKQN